MIRRQRIALARYRRRAPMPVLGPRSHFDHLMREVYTSPLFEPLRNWRPFDGEQARFVEAQLTVTPFPIVWPDSLKRDMLASTNEWKT